MAMTKELSCIFPIFVSHSSIGFVLIPDIEDRPGGYDIKATSIGFVLVPE